VLLGAEAGLRQGEIIAEITLQEDGLRKGNLARPPSQPVAVEVQVQSGRHQRLPSRSNRAALNRLECPRCVELTPAVSNG